MDEPDQIQEQVDMFHRGRRAFAVVNDALWLLRPGDRRAHSEWMPEKIVDLDDYRKYPRGMAVKGRVFWYQDDNFRQTSLLAIVRWTPKVLAGIRMPEAAVAAQERPLRLGSGASRAS